MVFSSMAFLCVFLPCVFLMYTVLPGIRLKNILLLIASLLFYAYGEPAYVLLMLASALLNYSVALLISKYENKRKMWIALGVAVNLVILCVFKYTGFLVQSFNDLSHLAFPVPEIRLPVGISFFTFQAMSYIIDVYRRETKAQSNFAKVLLYISFFPQLIAGPIVKYHDIQAEIDSRNQTTEGVYYGIRRFIAGLAKKVLIANFMAVMADTVFGAAPESINILVAWTGAAAYLLQIYFDFSGYSDMAIGLGWMFGFHFKENFRYPYTALGIRDFWKKWHISLSGWFKDYLYIPLGGNRRGRGRTCFNKFVVFLCTGIWHGANVTFLFWGIYHGFFLMLEEFVPFFRREGGRRKRAFLHMYTVLVVLIGFVFFRADTIGEGIFMVGQMFGGIHFEAASAALLLSVLTPANLLALLAGIIGCIPLKRYLEREKEESVYPFYKKKGYEGVLTIISLAVFVICLLNLAGGTYNPFIYFRF